jgi:PAS domain S-box-containing protein
VVTGPAAQSGAGRGTTEGRVSASDVVTGPGARKREVALFASAVGAIVAIVGALILGGWAIGEVIVPSGVAVSPAVKANTGLGFLLMGMALALREWHSAGRVARLLGAGGALIGTLTLIEYTFGAELGIDQLLFSDHSPLHPGRMAPNTATCFVLLGTALLLPEQRSPRWQPAEATALIGALISWLALIGIAADLPGLVTVGSFVRMAAPTAGCLILLAVGVAITVRGGQLAALVVNDGPVGSLVRRLLLAALVVPLAVSLILRAGHSAGVLDDGAVILLLIGSVALTSLAVALSFARSLRRSDEERAGEGELRRAILATARDAIVTADASGRIVGFNRAAERMFGLPDADALGLPLTILMPERFHDPHRAGLRRFLAGGAPRAVGSTVELAGRRSDGEEFPLELSLAAFAHGNETFFTGILNDITARKRAEGERAAYRASLERSNADLAQFANVASHDLQEPLRTIGGFVQLLERRYQGQLDSEADTFIDHIGTGVGRLQALIDGLLSYSRAGQGALRSQPVDSRQVVEQTLDSLDAVVRETGAQVMLGDLPTLRTDPRSLAQVFQNLLSNALKFTDHSRPHVQVSAEPENGAWCFAVTDNGIGIDPDKAERIFGMFQRLNTREEYDGTGIGLAVCKQMVERAGGRIWCEPAPGGGTVFRFTIPESEEMPT